MTQDVKRFPLVRTKRSNEKDMANLFKVLLLYLAARWFSGGVFDVGALARFAAVLAVALAVDAACNLARYKRFLCSVSAAVTAAVACVLAPEASLPLLIAATALSLVIAKHLPGGAGKNALNPAMVALALIAVAEAAMGASGAEARAMSFLASEPVGTVALALAVLAMLCSLPFASYRPFAASGFFVATIAVFIALRASIAGIDGMSSASAALSGIDGVSSASAVSGAGAFAISASAPLASLAFAIFYSAIAMTDPVTVSRRPVFGAIAGALCGALTFAVPAAFMPFAVLGVNLASRIADRAGLAARAKAKPAGRARFRRAVRLDPDFRTVDADRSEAESVDRARLSALSPSDILDLIQASSVVGLGGAGFPTGEKIAAFLSSNPISRGRTFIVNAVECDPGLVHDAWLLQTRGEAIAEGISLAMRACGLSSATIAVKRGGKIGFALPEGVSVFRAGNFYPAGAERVLIRAVSGVALSHDAIPAREGFLVLNVQTVLALRDAILRASPAEGSPDRRDPPGPRARERYITVADLDRGIGRPVRVREGERILDIASREFPGPRPVFAGGGAMQAFRAGDGDLVDRGTNFVAVAGIAPWKESPQCSRCGMCERACPAGIPVRAVAELFDAGKAGAALSLGAGRCLSCGSCSAACLAGKNLSHRVSSVKRLDRERTG